MFLWFANVASSDRRNKNKCSYKTQKSRCSLISCRVAVGIAKNRKISITSAKADIYTYSLYFAF